MLKQITDKRIERFLKETLEDIRTWNYSDYIIYSNMQSPLDSRLHHRDILIKIFVFYFQNFNKNISKKGYYITVNQISHVINSIYDIFPLPSTTL